MRRISDYDVEKQERSLVWDDNLGGYIAVTNQRSLKAVSPEEWVEMKNSGKHDNDVCYNIAHDKMIVTTGYRDQASSSSLPAGIYETGWTPDMEPIIRKHSLSPDAYVDMSGPLKDIINEIQWFLDSKEAYEDMGLTWRRGLLIYGPPGNGKTRAIMEAARLFGDRARVFVISDISAAKPFRNLVSDMPAICVVEEITEAIEEEGPQQFLNFLDGVEAWSNCITIATTNYPEKLEANIVDRPSRFDKLYLVDNPNAEARRLYLSRMLPPEEVTDDIIDDTDGMSIAYLKELVVQRKLRGTPISKSLSDFFDRKRIIKKSFAKKSDTDLGF